MTGPEIKLVRKYQPYVADILLHISVPRSREEFAALLQFGAECENKNTDFTPEIIASEFIPIAPIIVAQRLLQRMCDLGLVEIKGKTRQNGTSLNRPFPRLPRTKQAFIVTRLGHEAIEDRSVFMPERKSGRIFYVQDILYPDHILSFEEVEESLHETIQKTYSRENDHQKSERHLLDDWLYDVEGTKINLLDGTEEYVGTVRIDRILPTMRVPRENFQPLRFELDIEKHHEMSLELEFNGKIHKLPTSHLQREGVTYDKVLIDLLKITNTTWNTDFEAVPVQFNKHLKNESLSERTS